MNTLLLDTVTWDLLADLDGNIAMASDPYSQAQDAASAMRTFLGECYYDTTIGVPYLQNILGQAPPLSYIRSQLVAAAMTVSGVTAATAFFTAWIGRRLTGQVQITNKTQQQSATVF